MARSNCTGVRNLAVCGHASAGKTKFVDRLLAASGAIAGAPDVNSQSSVCDFDEEERAHGHSIETALVHLRHGDTHVNLLDTPGRNDFVGAMISALAAADCAVVCINAHSGVQLGARRAMDEARKAGIGRILMLTKIDDPQTDFSKTVNQCRDVWGASVLPIQVPIGQGGSLSGIVSAVELPVEARGAVMNLAYAHEQLVEKLVESNEEWMERYFDGEMPDTETLDCLLREGIVKGTIIPIMCCSPLTGTGISEALDVLTKIAPPPQSIDRYSIDDTGTRKLMKQTADAPVAARVFQVRVDPFVQKLSYVRIFSGTLAKDDTAHVSGVRKDVKLNPLLRVQADKTDPVDSASAGDIVAIAKMEELHVGSSLGLSMPTIEFPEPMVGLAISPTRRGDENKLSTAMNKLTEEDPTLKLSRDPQTAEMVMTGMSELHLQVLRERLARRDKIDVDTHEPRIPYRETIARAADGSYRHKKQSGGRGQFGEVHIRMLPLPRGTEIEEFATKDRFPSMKSHHYHPDLNFLWVDSVVGGSIPGNFLPAIEKGFLDRINQGVLAGYPIRNVAVEVHDGKHHPVDSSEAAFKIAGSLCFREVFLQASPSLLEPIVLVEIVAPEANVGDIYSDMSSRGGRVLGSDAAGGGMHSIDCEVPLRCVGHYSRTLSSITAGQGSYSLHFSHYEAVPGDVQNGLMEAAKHGAEEEMHA